MSLEKLDNEQVKLELERMKRLVPERVKELMAPELGSSMESSCLDGWLNEPFGLLEQTDQS